MEKTQPKCPHCHASITWAELFRQLREARRAKGSFVISEAQQAKMQAGRRKAAAERAKRQRQASYEGREENNYGATQE